MLPPLYYFVPTQVRSFIQILFIFQMIVGRIFMCFLLSLFYHISTGHPVFLEDIDGFFPYNEENELRFNTVHGDGYKYEEPKRSLKNAMMGSFGSDGYLYDFVKRSGHKKRLGKEDFMADFGSDGHLYDFVKKSYSQHNQGSPKRSLKHAMLQDFGSDGYLYDFI